MTIRDVRVRDCSAMSLSHLLHGYLSVYAMVRVSPALEREYGTLQEIHGRLREIAKELSKTMKDTSIELDERIGYVADLMDAYQTYSDMDLLNEALDVTYRILTVDEKGEIMIPGRTPNVCRLLCNWYYFTGEEECVELAKSIIKEWGNEQNFKVLALWRIVRAIEFYNNVTDIEEKIDSRMELFEELFSRENSDKFEDVVLYFEILSVKSYEEI